MGDVSIEDLILAGNCFYIHSFERDAEENLFSFRLICDPEIQKIVRVVKFSGVQWFTEEMFDYDNDVMPSIIGITETRINEDIRYVITTDMSEITFVTKEMPYVENIP
jgi:hypothetical protein